MTIRTAIILLICLLLIFSAASGKVVSGKLHEDYGDQKESKNYGTAGEGIKCHPSCSCREIRSLNRGINENASLPGNSKGIPAFIGKTYPNAINIININGKDNRIDQDLNLNGNDNPNSLSTVGYAGNLCSINFYNFNYEDIYAKGEPARLVKQTTPFYPLDLRGTLERMVYKASFDEIERKKNLRLLKQIALRQN